MFVPLAIALVRAMADVVLKGRMDTDHGAYVSADIHPHARDVQGNGEPSNEPESCGEVTCHSKHGLPIQQRVQDESGPEPEPALDDAEADCRSGPKAASRDLRIEKVERGGWVAPAECQLDSLPDQLVRSGIYPRRGRRKHELTVPP